MNPERIHQSTEGFDCIFIHSAVDDAGLSAAEFRVYGNLARRASDMNGCFPGVDNIAEVCKLNIKTVRAAIHALTAKRMIICQERPGRSNRYYITPKSQWVIDSDPSQTRGGVPLLPNGARGPSQTEPGAPPKRGGGKDIQEGNPMKEGKGRGPQNPDGAMSVPIPVVLQFEAFLNVWALWLTDRRIRKKPVTEIAARLQLEKLAKYGPEKAVASVKQSMESGYQGLFEPKYETTRTNTRTNPRNVGQFDDPTEKSKGIVAALAARERKQSTAREQAVSGTNGVATEMAPIDGSLPAVTTTS